VCESSCPEQVPIADVLRHKMYAEDYGALPMAQERYGALSHNAAACLSCGQQSCLRACPHGLEIPGLTRQAHQLLAVE
jgi:predicted aldo/keto reductase-like oxidoreductase